MSAIQAEPPSIDALVVRLDGVLAELADPVADNGPALDADRIDRIARRRGTCARGNQAREMPGAPDPP